LAQPVVVREQRTLFQPTLDDMIPQDHEVRLLDKTLRTLEWAPWEAKYKRGGPGQPPIHPQVLADLWLYAMMRRIRTSRPLEYACGHNLNFMWLAEGRTPDYSTLATFFSTNKEPLKDLFKQVCRKSMTMGMVRLGEVGFDATRVKAANSRYAALTTPSIEKKLAAIDAQIDAIAEATATALEDAATTGFGAGTEVPEGLKSLEQRRKQIAEVARTRDAERRQSGTDPKKKPVRCRARIHSPKLCPTRKAGTLRTTHRRRKRHHSGCQCAGRG
jgi:transposase